MLQAVSNGASSQENSAPMSQGQKEGSEQSNESVLEESKPQDDTTSNEPRKELDKTQLKTYLDNGYQFCNNHQHQYLMRKDIGDKIILSTQEHKLYQEIIWDIRAKELQQHLRTGYKLVHRVGACNIFYLQLNKKYITLNETEFKYCNIILYTMRCDTIIKWGKSASQDKKAWLNDTFAQNTPKKNALLSKDPNEIIPYINSMLIQSLTGMIDENRKKVERSLQSPPTGQNLEDLGLKESDTATLKALSAFENNEIFFFTAVLEIDDDIIATMLSELANVVENPDQNALEYLSITAPTVQQYIGVTEDNEDANISWYYKWNRYRMHISSESVESAPVTTHAERESKNDYPFAKSSNTKDLEEMQLQIALFASAADAPQATASAAQNDEDDSVFQAAIVASLQSSDLASFPREIGVYDKNPKKNKYHTSTADDNAFLESDDDDLHASDELEIEDSEEDDCYASRPLAPPSTGVTESKQEEDDLSKRLAKLRDA